MNRARILIVDDESDVRALLRELLERAGYEVVEAENGVEGLRVLFRQRPDLIILDLTMPELDGWATLGRIRELSDVPVLLLSARQSELEKVRGLKAGADDYLTKPFGRQELIARAEALLRRPRAALPVPDAYADGLVTIDFAQRSVRVADKEVQLTPREFTLLAAFVQHPNQVLSRGQLLEIVWGDPSRISTGQVKLYVGYLRKKLGATNAGDGPIETVRGFGYRYRPAA